MRAVVQIGSTAVLVGALVACAAPERDPLEVAAVPRDADAYNASLEAQRAQRIEILIARADQIARGATADDTIDILMLSGGADWGAFGAGYLAGWSDLGEAAAFPMPEFDAIGGISTGALIATYVAGQGPENYAGIETFYRNTSADWIGFKGLGGFLPDSPALVDNSEIRHQVELALDDALLADLRESYADKRQVLAATTNVDYAELQYWDLGREASQPGDPKPRIVDILMAATGIPGVFPPGDIDGNLHVDGYAVQGIPAIDIRAVPLFRDGWRERYGDRPLPKLRLWWIYNNQLSLAPQAVGLSWLDVLFRGYQTMSQTSFKAPLESNLVAVKAANERGLAIELRYVSIPDSFVANPELKPFDPGTTNVLADLGREVAASPDGGWRTTLPD